MDLETNSSAVWALRIWKLHAVEAAKVTGHDREEAIHNSDSVAGVTVQKPKLSLAFVVKAGFAVTKV